MLNFQLHMYDKSLKVRLKKGTKNEERPFVIILVFSIIILVKKLKV